MNELQSILAARRELGPEKAEAVLATVVHVHGSAYRRPGARMLVLPGGRRIGTVSGGCLEGDVARKAAWWTSRGESVLRTFDNSSPDVAWDFGLGCNGIISILIEKLEWGPVKATLDFLEARQAAGAGCVVVTVIRTSVGSSLQVGERGFWEAPGRCSAGISSALAGIEVQAAVHAAFSEHGSRMLHTRQGDIFVEWVGLPQKLVVFGAGHDVVPLVQMASILGWRITVVDSREAYAHASRFPGAQKVIALPPDGAISGVEIDRETAVVVMTHNYPLDQVILPQVLKHKPSYLGLLGPRTRAEGLFREIGADLSSPFVHAPVGLDIGSDHPETIALSIIAEIQAFLSGRSSGSLRWRKGAIHAAAKVVGAEPSPCWEGHETTRLEACEVSRLMPIK